MQSQLATLAVDRAVVSGHDVPSSLGFDSIVVTSAQIFIKDVKLHSDVDSIGKDDHDGTIKTGPFVLTFDSSGTHIVTSVGIPPGTYDRIKFEIHKPDKNDVDDQAVLANFPQFVSGNQTYTVVINGYTVMNGVRTYFTVSSHASYNITYKIKDTNLTDLDSIVLGANVTTKLAFEFDPRLVFKINGNLFDPRDSTHQSDIDKSINIAIVVVKL